MFPETADLLGSSPQPSPGFPEDGPEREDIQMLMSEVRGEWTDWLEMMERRQELNQGLQNTISEQHWNLEADVLQQQKTTPGVSAVS